MTLSNNKHQSLSNLHLSCLQQNIPFASYKLPLQSEIITMVQHQSMPEKIESIQYINNKSGFLIAPFFETEKNNLYFLTPEKVFENSQIDDEFLQSLASNFLFKNIVKPSKNEIDTTTKEDFIQQVKHAKEAIKDGKFSKVVLSRVKLEKLHNNFNASDLFLELSTLYPYAFVYMIQLPQVGVWIGASPEPFLIIADEKVQTVSLAGTQLATECEIENYNWTNKEIEEQGIVTSYVEKALHSFSIYDYVLNGPYNYKAANLIHLKSSFEFKLNDLGQNLGNFINALHPTPSVGGLPKNAARDFILEYEKHNRAYYTGFLGPINMHYKSNLFVNLRCLQLFETQFALYSGAGITLASNPENEWDETNNKMKTLMNVITQNP